MSPIISKFIFAFLMGGTICLIGQLLMQRLHLTPAHTMVSFVVAGAVLGGLGWYQPLIDIAGAGATTPITSFGNSLVQGALTEYMTGGWIGLLTGIFEVTGAGISTAIIFSFLAALFFKPHS